MSATALGGCASKFIPPNINYDAAVPATLTVDPPPPVKIVELPKLLPLPGQLKPLDTGKPAPESADPTVRVNQAMRPRACSRSETASSTPFRSIPIRRARSIRLIRRPARSPTSPCRDGEQLVGTARSPPATRSDGSSATPRAGAGPTKKVHILVKPTRPDPRHEPGHQHRSADLSAGAALDREDLHGVRLVAVPRGPAHRAAPAEPSGSSGGADCDRDRPRLDPFPLRDRRATPRPGDRCAPSTTGRRSTSSFRPASAKVRCRRSSSSARRWVRAGELPRPRQLLHRRPSLRRRGASPRRQGQRAPRPHRPHRWKAAVMTAEGPQEEQAAPVVAPDLRLRGERPRVTRLSRKVLITLGAVSALAIAGALGYALQTHNKGLAGQELLSTQNQPSAEGLAGLPKDYTGLPRQAPPLGPPLPGDLGKPILNAGAAPNTTVPGGGTGPRGPAPRPGDGGGAREPPVRPDQSAAPASRRDRCRFSGDRGQHDPNPADRCRRRPEYAGSQDRVSQCLDPTAERSAMTSSRRRHRPMLCRQGR